MRVVAILTAAGSGHRLGRDLPKALVPLAGQPLVVRAARGLVDSGEVDEVIVTAPADHRADLDAALTQADLGVPVMVVTGGSTRQASVAAALAVVPPTADVVLVHDAARPLASADLVARVVHAVRAGHPAVVPGVPVTDTIKVVDLPEARDGARGVVEPDDPGLAAPAAAPGDALAVRSTPDRSTLRAVQTPQGFTRELLERAHAAGARRAASEATAASDDAGLVEALGETVRIVAGEIQAMKITTPVDLALAELLLAEADR